jgi:formylglycine-generating enzyme required for sulfatase activity
MADIFISYSQKDRDRVARLVDALTAEGYEVWWDLKIRAGESFDELIESTLERVACVVGVWSQSSVKSEWVRAESAWARDRGIFVSVRIDDEARLPLKFYNVHTTSLARWNGSPDAAEFRSLVGDIAVLAGAPKPATSAADPRSHSPRDAAGSWRTLMPEPLSRFRDRLRDGGEGPEMVVIPAGRFWMGSTEAEAGRMNHEGPRHQVEIRQPFGVGRTPVTFADYDRFAESRGGDKPTDQGWGRGNRPVIDVCWDDAVAYAQWLSDRTGKRYRLLTEAEWEYACRAGTETPWSFGDEPKDLDLYAWHGGNSDGGTHPVGEKKANPWGLHDVHGNVWEWVQDCWHGGYQGAPTDGSSWEKANGGNCGRRVVRGGSWKSIPVFLRSANRIRVRDRQPEQLPRVPPRPGPLTLCTLYPYPLSGVQGAAPPGHWPRGRKRAATLSIPSFRQRGETQRERHRE